MKTFLYIEALTIADLKNIVAIRNLVLFYQKHPNAQSGLETWLSVTKHAIWQKPSDVVQDFPDADPVKNNRVVFNIAKNKYRLIVQISYPRQWVFIKFIGTHSAYDTLPTGRQEIDASTVDQF